MNRTLLCLLIVTLLAAAAPASAQTIPPLLSHQGRILDSDNMPLRGTEPLIFTRYDGAQATTVLW